MDSLLARYQQGEYQKVWEELVALGDVMSDEHIFSDALSVAQETMRRVRHNVEILMPRLKELGYEFGYAWMEERPDITEEWMESQLLRFAPPASTIEQDLHEFEQLVGPLPFSLRAFYTEVGEINFFGRHLTWERLFFDRKRTSQIRIPNLDPLAVSGLRKEECMEDYLLWQEQGQEADHPSPYRVSIALDYDLKYNVSGSGAYEIEVPSRCADVPLLDEWHHTTFVNFLRICLYYGGLPGLEIIEDQISDELQYIRKDLLPF